MSVPIPVHWNKCPLFEEKIELLFRCVRAKNIIKSLLPLEESEKFIVQNETSDLIFGQTKLIYELKLINFCSAGNEPCLLLIRGLPFKATVIGVITLSNLF